MANDTSSIENHIRDIVKQQLEQRSERSQEYEELKLERDRLTAQIAELRTEKQTQFELIMKQNTATVQEMTDLKVQNTLMKQTQEEMLDNLTQLLSQMRVRPYHQMLA